MLFDLDSDPEEEHDLGNDPGHTEVCTALIAEARRIWDAEALQAEIDLSIARRLLIRRAHDQGEAPRWDYQVPQSDARWCRTGSASADSPPCTTM